MLPFEEFCNDPNEVHSMVWGFREGMINPKDLRPSEMPTGIPNKIHDETCEYISKEYHYYIGGFYLAKLVYLVALILVAGFGIELL